MRLIDADKLKERIEENILTIEKNTQGKRNGKVFAYGAMVGLESAKKSISEQPTAYDPDRVVEQLEERTTFLKECTKYGNKDAEQQEKSYATMMMYEVAYLVDDLLEIVKGGGVDAF